MHAFRLGILSYAFLFAACSKTPDREKFPGGHGRTSDIQAVETQRAVLGGFDPMRSNLPTEGGGANAPASGAPAEPGKSLIGTIKLGRNVVVSENMIFFLSARTKEGGPPLAAKRMPRPEFPYAFTLSQSDSMTGAPLEGEVYITARLDKDGDPLTHEAGDYMGSVHAKVGDKNIVITIDKPGQ